MTRKQRTVKKARTRRGPWQSVHIRVAYAGKGEPAPAVLEKLLKLEVGLLVDRPGEIQTSTATGGSMDIVVVTTAAQETVEAAWRLANDLGLSANTTVKIERRGMEG
jgi:diaminopimelate decarboxylase